MSNPLKTRFHLSRKYFKSCDTDEITPFHPSGAILADLEGGVLLNLREEQKEVTGVEDEEGLKGAAPIRKLKENSQRFVSKLSAYPPEARARRAARLSSRSKRWVGA